MYLIAEVLKSGKRYIATEYPFDDLADATKEIKKLRIKHPRNNFELIGAFRYPENRVAIEDAKREGLRRQGRRVPLKKVRKSGKDWWKDDPQFNGDPPF